MEASGQHSKSAKTEAARLPVPGLGAHTTLVAHVLFVRASPEARFREVEKSLCLLEGEQQGISGYV